jgi:hypothetical protein
MGGAEGGAAAGGIGAGLSELEGLGNLGGMGSAPGGSNENPFLLACN